MQPGRNIMVGTSAKPILMDRLGIKAPNAHPKVINLIIVVNAPAQATNPMPRKSAFMVITLPDTRVRCLDFSIRFSQNSRLLSPQGLFISSIDHQ